LIAGVVFGVLGWAANTVNRGYEFRDNLADKPWVNVQLIDARKYTDEQIALVHKDVEQLRKDSEQIRKDAFEHSDANRQAMLLQMSQMDAEFKAIMADHGAKLDILVHNVQDLHQQPYAKRK
jgi:hypothetical protein